MKNLFYKKPITVPSDQTSTSDQLKRCLTSMDLTLLGIGAIIGAGVFVLTGIAAAIDAGPSIIISFVIAGIACAFAALSYAELSSSIGGCGSAYGYAYAGLGEILAWIIGWDLILEYVLVCPVIALGWSSYVNNLLTAIGIHLPSYLLHGPFEVGGMINLPAALIIVLLAIMLGIGTKQSARFNALMVAIKLLVICLFVVIALMNINPANWHPFMPFGWSGIVKGAAFIFFAYIGFDAISTAAEEARNPQKDVPFGIIASLIVCALIYMIVAGLLTGMASYTTLKVESPISSSLLNLGYRFSSALIAVGAVAGLTTAILAMFYGGTRVFLAMSRDQLLPALFSKISPRTQTPINTIIIIGSVMTILAGIVPINALAELVNIGTLAAFAMVCCGVIVLRITQPNLARPFKVPYSPLLPLLGVLTCIYLMFGLSGETWLRFGIWMVIGIIIYFSYSRFHALKAR